MSSIGVGPGRKIPVVRVMSMLGGGAVAVMAEMATVPRVGARIVGCGAIGVAIVDLKLDTGTAVRGGGESMRGSRGVLVSSWSCWRGRLSNCGANQGGILGVLGWWALSSGCWRLLGASSRWCRAGALGCAANLGGTMRALEARGRLVRGSMVGGGMLAAHSAGPTIGGRRDICNCRRLQTVRGRGRDMVNRGGCGNRLILNEEFVTRYAVLCVMSCWMGNSELREHHLRRTQFPACGFAGPRDNRICLY